MHGKGKFQPSYNVETAVDTDSHLIAEFEVTNKCTDQGQLTSMAKLTKESLGLETIQVVADKGYDSRKDILKSINIGVIANVIPKYDKGDRYFNLKYEKVEITEDIKNSTEPEDIQKCIKAGVTPKCYEGTNIEIELQTQNGVSCFIRDEKGNVTCPMGHKFSKLKERGENTIYGNKDECRQCPNRCTGGTRPRTVSFGPNTKYVKVKIYGNPKKELQKIPDIPQNTPYNSFYRKDDIKKKVVIRIKFDKEKYHLRKCTVEHPFGTIKWYDGAHYVLCKGIEKVSAEMGLSYLAYNLKRVINMVGTKAIIEAIQG